VSTFNMSPEHDRTDQLYRAFAPVVHRCCLRLLKDEEAALDATQEVFVKLVVNFPRIQGREEILPWILRVARNHCLNVRRAARHVATLAKHLQHEESESSVDLNRALLARTLLDRFDAATQRVVLGVIGAGYRHEDAAAALGLSPATVSRKVQRFLTKTRAELSRAQHAEAAGIPPARSRAHRAKAAPAKSAAPVKRHVLIEGGGGAETSRRILPDPVKSAA
jgi:RNA polymerase sigma-70 factor, ECF subfamily